jgi:glycopeptide antibiotics resistance protein
VNLLKNHRLWRVVLIAMLVPLAFIAFWPSPVDQPVAGQLAAVLKFLHRHGIPAWFNYQFVEAFANVALFVPLGMASSLAFPTWRLWQIGGFGLLISACMELGQRLFLQARFPSPLDLMTNTSGAVIGALLAVVVLKKLQARRLPAADL